MNVRVWLFAMIDVWLGMIDAMLFGVPNSFPRSYLNSKLIPLVVRSKGPSSRGHYIYGT